MFGQYLPHQTCQWVSSDGVAPLELDPPEDKEEPTEINPPPAKLHNTLLLCKFHLGLCFKGLLLFLSCFVKTYFCKSISLFLVLES